MSIKKLALLGMMVVATMPALAAAPYNTLSGGVTDDERAQIDSQERNNYSLKLQFARPSGEFVTDVAVSVTDAKGSEVVNQKSDGPYFLIALPPGSYTVTAQVDGQVKTQKVDIGATGQKSYTIRFNVP